MMRVLTRFISSMLRLKLLGVLRLQNVLIEALLGRGRWLAKKPSRFSSINTPKFTNWQQSTKFGRLDKEKPSRFGFGDLNEALDYVLQD